jgi:periplasmic protein CpxP/Spy
MRSISQSFVLSAALLVGLSGSMLMAQDQSQPRPGAPPPAANSQTAQPHKSPNPHHQAKVMAKKLGLSKDQQSKLEPILADRDRQVQSLRADASLDPKDRHAKIQGIRQDSDSKIESILSDSQKQQYEQIKQQRAQRGHQGTQQSDGNSPTA